MESPRFGSDATLGRVRLRFTVVLTLASALTVIAPALQAEQGRNKKARLLGLAAGATLGGLMAASEKGDQAPRLDEPRAWDLALTAGSVGIVVASHFQAPCVGVECCRWCDAKDGRPRLNRLDGRVAQALRWTDRHRADVLSDATLAATFGQAIGYVSFGNRPAALRDGALLAESYALTVAVTQVTKKLARRPRPYAHREDPPPGTRLDSQEARVSFFSGHTSSAFCLAVATGAIAFARNEKNAGVVLGSGLALATATGYLRIAADQHYFTDALVGAVVGSAAGFLVPHLHRPSTPTGSVSGEAPTPRAGFTVPLALGGTRQGALTAAYAGGPSLTLHLAW